MKTWNWISPYNILVFVTCFLSSSFALTQEKIGQDDWLIRSIGPVTDMKCPSAGRLCYTSSESSFIHAVEKRSGKEAWRTRVEAAAEVYHLDYSEVGTLVSSQRSQDNLNSLKILNSVDGALLFQKNFSERFIARVLGRQILVASPSNFYVLNARDGAIIRELPFSHQFLGGVMEVTSKNEILMLLQETTNQVAIVRSNVIVPTNFDDLHFTKDEKLMNAHYLNLSNVSVSSETSSSLFANDSFYILPSEKTDKMIKFSAETNEVLDVSLPSPSSRWAFSTKSVSSSPVHQKIYIANDRKEVFDASTLKNVSQETVGINFYCERSQQDVFISKQQKKLVIYFQNSKNIKKSEFDLSPYLSSYSLSSVTVDNIWPSNLQSHSTSFVVRLSDTTLVHLAVDDSLGVSRVWIRYEGVARVLSSVVFNLSSKIPKKKYSLNLMSSINDAKKNIENLISPQGNLMETVNSQKSMFDVSEATIANDLLETIKNIQEEHNNFYKNKFGVNDLILLLSQSGELFGVHVASGSLLLLANARTSVPGSADLFALKSVSSVEKTSKSDKWTAKSIAVSSNSDCELILTEERANGRDKRLRTIKLLSNEEANVREFKNIQFSSSLILPEGKFTLLAEETLTYHIYPSSPLSSPTLSSLRLSHYNYETQSLTGYALGGHHKLIPVWSMSDMEGQIALVRANNNITPLQTSPLQVRGYDTTVSYKYDAKNLMGIYVKNSTQQKIVFLNSYTGDVIHSVSLPEETARDSVDMTIFDNKSIVSFYHQKFSRTVFISLEFLWDTVVASPIKILSKHYWHQIRSLGDGEQSQVFSPYSSPSPKVGQQSFILNNNSRVIGLTTSKTRMGISNFDVIFFDDNFAIVRLPYSLFSPSRQILNKYEDLDIKKLPYSEDGLFSYFPLLTMSPFNYLNYDRPLSSPLFTRLSLPEKRRNSLSSPPLFISQPTELESTSYLVSLHQNDLFASKILTSNHFDHLPEDFNKPLLLLTGVALIVIVQILRIQANDSEIKKSWK